MLCKTYDIPGPGTYKFKFSIDDPGINEAPQTKQTTENILSFNVVTSANSATSIIPPSAITINNPITSAIVLNYNITDADGISNIDTNGVGTGTSNTPTGELVVESESYNPSTGLFQVKLVPQNGLNTSVAVGTYGLKLNVIDACGSFVGFSNSGLIRIQNQGPTVNITSPQNNTNLTLPVSQSFVGNATDPDQTTFSSYNWSISGFKHNRNIYSK